MTDPELDELGQALTWDEPDPERVERLRTALIASAPSQQTRRHGAELQGAEPPPDPAGSDGPASPLDRSQRVPSSRYLWLAALLASCFVGVYLWPQADPQSASAGIIEPSAAAQFTRLGGRGDEVIRLTDGALRVKVSQLRAGQRFRVVTADAEVEVRGTEFRVEAEAGSLRAVHVTHGRVEVRRDGKLTLLHAGQTWESEAQAAATASAGTAGAEPALSAATASAAPALSAAPGAAPSPPDRRARSHAAHVAHAPAAQATPAAPATARRDVATAPPKQATSGKLPGDTKGPVEAPEEAAFREGYAALRDGDPNRAEAAFSRSAQAGPLAEDASFWRAVSLLRAGRKQAASAAFQGFLRRYPKSVRRAEAEQMLGKL